MKKKRKWAVFILLIILALIAGFFYMRSMERKQSELLRIERTAEAANRNIAYEEDLLEEDILKQYQSVNSDVVMVLVYAYEDEKRVIPVVCTPSDPDYYFRRDLNGDSDSMGTVFIDDNSAPDAFNIILNGHSSKSRDTHFTFLKQFADPIYFKEHNRLLLIDESGERIYETVSFHEIDYERERDVSHDFYKGDFPSEEEFKDALEKLDRYVINKRISDISQYGDMLTLITCNMDKNDSRYILIAREVDK